MPTLTIAQIDELAGLEPDSAPVQVFGGPQVSRVAAIGDATPNALVFAQDEPSFVAALASSAGIILASRKLVAGNAAEHPSKQDPRVLAVDSPRYVFALAAKALARRSGDEDQAASIHPSASVHPTATLGARAQIGAQAVVEAGVTLGDDVTLGSGVVICTGTTLGSRVVVQAGAVLGGAGFGYATHPATGEHVLFPQQGTLVIEDDVEIGANTTIDRGALGETRIGAGTKIDNQVHIGHNCRIGRNVLIAAQVGISGSCTIGDGVVMAGQVGLGDHVTIGPGVILGGASGVFPGKRLEGPGQMFMGVPAEPLKDYLKSIARVRRLK
jgi:UDP-3-O-[3-hydroxymyristoyl] glucosamine N-acyltransferase